MKFWLEDETQTEAFGAKIYHQLSGKRIIFLQGPLGAGKTTLVRGFLRAVGHTGAVKSPTFTLVEEYVINSRLYYHFDLYRISDPEELEWIGLRDYLDGQAVVFIEWPELGNGLLPEPDLVITLREKEQGREIEIQGLALTESV